MPLSTYFDIRKSFPFYAAYHREWRNVLIHVACVPAIATTTLYFLSHVKVPLGSLGKVSFADILITAYGGSFLFMEPIAGTLYLPALYGMRELGTKTLAGHRELAILINVVSWIAQFIGHGLFEGRKPALMDSFGQSVHAAVFFVWLEVLFFLGYRPALKKELDEAAQKVVDSLA
eukprot:Hpha_TRINITY_DN10403_c0_g1::TRINITY_DN10403_c0_g1_i1::g.193356::m.193356